MIQYYYSDQHGKVTFLDKGQNTPSVKCQPRDIQIISGDDSCREEIAIDIRLGQGYSAIGIARGLKGS